MKTNKILIVDDIFSNRLLLSSTLESLGIDSESAADGQKAIKLLETEVFGMVFLDIEMPVMNGIETVRYIRKEMQSNTSQLPVIALTAHNPTDYGDDINTAGFNEIVSKPYSVDKLSKLIDKYLKH
ncbi:MAG: response regulator [Bacteroidales bacterium]|nr:response regulator [Bacteroidales bacterium]MBN2758085.1 response regulator [Bacteroidales bacterium]